MFALAVLSRCIMEVEHCIVACSKDGWSPPPNVRAEPAQLASYSIGLKQCLMDLEKLIANIPITDRTLVCHGSCRQMWSLSYRFAGIHPGGTLYLRHTRQSGNS